MEEQRNKILTFERLCEDGNVLVKLSELNAESMVRKLFLVEDDPQKVWDALISVYGHNYFKEVIEKSMGITSDYKDKLDRYYKQKLKETTHENEMKLTQIERSLKDEVNTLRTQYKDQLLLQIHVTEQFNNEFKAKVD